MQSMNDRLHFLCLKYKQTENIEKFKLLKVLYIYLLNIIY